MSSRADTFAAGLMLFLGALFISVQLALALCRAIIRGVARAWESGKLAAHRANRRRQQGSRPC